MKPPLEFLTVDQLLAIHQREIREFGGQAGLRDRGLLESAVAMPYTQFDGKFLHPDLASRAAAYLFHLCKNHAFVDGNKRTAAAAALMHILDCGASLNASEQELEGLTRGVAGSEVSKEEVILFFSRRLRPKKASKWKRSR